MGSVHENPRTPPHFLTEFFPEEPSLVHQNRAALGDYYRKPTQYWSVNLKFADNGTKPSAKKQITRIDYLSKNAFPEKFRAHSRQVLRSLIAPDYAEYFIANHIVGSLSV